MKIFKDANNFMFFLVIVSGLLVGIKLLYEYSTGNTFPYTNLFVVSVIAFMIMFLILGVLVIKLLNKNKKH